jgi:hypothetical protein
VTADGHITKVTMITKTTKLLVISVNFVALVPSAFAVGAAGG